QREGPAPQPGAPINGCNIVVGIETGVDEVFARALALGASEASPLEDMEGVGRGGYLFDPDGNLFGLMSAVMSDGTNAMAG
ncbi:MAG TPA: VOC family protein, partial [Ornithinibacter sp.]|nr:VOC family protein [Ornithinibacter sp.]